MTYEMKIHEERDEARAEEQLSSIRNLMKNLGLSVDEAIRNKDSFQRNYDNEI